MRRVVTASHKHSTLNGLKHAERSSPSVCASASECVCAYKTRGEMREHPLFALTAREAEGQEAPGEPALEDFNKAARAVMHIMLMEINPIASLCFLLLCHNADKGTCLS